MSTALRSRIGRIGMLVAALLLLSSVALVGAGLLLRARVLDAVATTERLRPALASRDLQRSCAAIAHTAAAWNDAARVSQPLAPVLHRLGWLPNIGTDVALAPDLVAVAQTGAEAGVLGCTLIDRKSTRLNSSHANISYAV